MHVIMHKNIIKTGKIMANTIINISVDEKIKDEAQELFESMGLNMSTAINVFLTQSVNEHRIPFEIKQKTPNNSTLAAMEECEEMIANKTGKTFNSFDEFIQELNSDDDIDE